MIRRAFLGLMALFPVAGFGLKQRTEIKLVHFRKYYRDGSIATLSESGDIVISHPRWPVNLKKRCIVNSCVAPNSVQNIGTDSCYPVYAYTGERDPCPPWIRAHWTGAIVAPEPGSGRNEWEDGENWARRLLDCSSHDIEATYKGYAYYAIRPRDRNFSELIRLVREDKSLFSLFYV